MTDTIKTIDDFKSKINYEIARNRYNLARKVIVNKNFRPKMLEDQFELLNWVADVVDLPSYKILASVAASHKALECLNIDYCSISHRNLARTEHLFDELTQSDNLREDVLHTIYSKSTVSIFLLIYLEQWDSLTDEIFSSTLEYESRKTFNKGFYQTCGNIYRCYGFQFLVHMCRNDLAKAKNTLKKAEALLSRAIMFADGEETKFKEFTTYIISLGKAREILAKSKGSEQEATDLLYDYAKSLMRWQNQEKVEMLAYKIVWHYQALPESEFVLPNAEKAK